MAGPPACILGAMSRRRAGAALALLLLGGLAVLGWLLGRASPERRAPPASAAGAGGSPGALAAAVPAAPPPPAHLPVRVPAPQAAAAPTPGPPRFDGRVVAADTGEPVPDADLTFSRAGAAASARTGPDGAFRFEPPAEGRWLLAAVTARGFFPFAPEWGHSPVQLDARAGRAVRGIEIHLVRALSLEGRVVDEDGAAVEGAAIRLLGAVREATLVSIPDAFTSGPDGRFTFEAPEGTVVEARRAGYLPGRAEVNVLALLERRVTVRLGPAHAPLGEALPVSGRVVARDGGPLPGALVVAVEERRFGDEGVPAAQAAAGEGGTFVLPALDPGRYRITARHEGRAPASVRRVQPGTRDLVLELAPGGRLRGCVRSAASGAPVAPFSVLVFERKSALRLDPQRSLSVVDPSGCYALDDLVPGPAAVVFSAPGHAPTRELPVELPAEGEAVLDAALEAGGTVDGIVLDDATGAPLEGARVGVEGAFEAAASTFPVLSEAITDAAGRFTLAGLPRRFSFQVAARGHHGRVVGGVEVPPGARAGPMEVRLRPVAPGDEPRVELAGVGIVIAARGEALRIAQVAPGGGAAEAGLGRGDDILAVDGRPVTELGFGGTVDAIRGPEGSVVTLTVKRGDATFDVRVPRRLVRG
jgi:hypothetical protein